MSGKVFQSQTNGAQVRHSPFFSKAVPAKPSQDSFFQARISRTAGPIIQTKCNTFTGTAAAYRKWWRWERRLPAWKTQTQTKGSFLRIPVGIKMGRRKPRTENAIVYKPKSMTTPSAVDVFLYYHGYNAGYRAAKPQDEEFRISEQLNKSLKHLPNLLGVLPQGARPNIKFKETNNPGICRAIPRHSFRHYSYDINTYLGKIFQAIKLGAVSRGKMIVSGHSGGEYPVRGGMGIGARRRAGKRIPGHWKLRSEPNMVILFDAINAGASEGIWWGQIAMWIRNDVKVLRTLKPGRMLAYLKSSFKFRAYYGAHGSYAGRHKRLAARTRRYIDRQTRPISDPAVRGQVRAQLKGNYRFVPVKTSHDFIGGGGTTAKRPLAEALQGV